ncbi:MAG TPA: dienelactone hydrolase family protein [Ilumatobacter sp.]|nr:dienelactone hydrolase family protein [Ilumatobacter sp.]
MIETEVDLATPDGAMKTFVYHPEGGGPHPLVLYLMDAPSIRPALKDMASRLATAGYYVMLPYLFYRGGPFREFGASDEDMHARQEMMATVTPAGILTDAATLLAYAEADPAADAARFGAVGFCMSGGLTLAVAKAYPGRAVAAASIHGAWLVRDTPDSPHLNLESATAEVYLGWADNDPTAPEEQRPIVTGALDAAGLTWTMDTYAEAVHGYAPAGPRYHRYASEQHWERVHDLMFRNLRLPS